MIVPVTVGKDSARIRCQNDFAIMTSKVSVADDQTSPKTNKKTTPRDFTRELEHGAGWESLGKNEGKFRKANQNLKFVGKWMHWLLDHRAMKHHRQEAESRGERTLKMRHLRHFDKCY